MQSFEGPYDAFVGFDVGKLAHRACCVLTGGAVAFNVGVASDEAAIDRVLAEAAAHGRALAVVDQRRNIGTTVVRRARAAGIEVAEEEDSIIAVFSSSPVLSPNARSTAWAQLQPSEKSRFANLA